MDPPKHGEIYHAAPPDGCCHFSTVDSQFKTYFAASCSTPEYRNCDCPDPRCRRLLKRPQQSVLAVAADNGNQTRVRPLRGFSKGRMSSNKPS